MSDRIPGTSYDNPIHYKGYRIYLTTGPWSTTYAYAHNDYDGAEDANDDRHGHCSTVEECKVEIDELCDDTNAIGAP